MQRYKTKIIIESTICWATEVNVDKYSTDNKPILFKSFSFHTKYNIRNTNYCFAEY